MIKLAKCKKCGYNLEKDDQLPEDRFPDYCREYCCLCCPTGHQVPCAMEKMQGWNHPFPSGGLIFIIPKEGDIEDADY